MTQAPMPPLPSQPLTDLSLTAILREAFDGLSPKDPLTAFLARLEAAK